MMHVQPVLLRDGLLKLQLSFEHVVRFSKTKTVAHPEHMGIHRDGGHAKGVGHDHVRSLAAHTRQSGQLLHRSRNFAAVAQHQQLAGLDDVRRLGFESAGLHHRVQLLHRGLRHARRVGESGEHRRGDLVDHLIRALCGKHNRHQRLVRVGEVELRACVGVEPG